MKKWIAAIVFFMLILAVQSASAQCAMCTKTASQLGTEPAKGLNSAILYLMLTPFLIGGFLGYRWWKSNQAEE